MRRPRPPLVLCVLLFLGLSLAVPAEDLTETAYDESEAQPCESTALISNVTPQAASATQTVPIAQLRQISILRQSRRYYGCWPLKGA